MDTVDITFYITNGRCIQCHCAIYVQQHFVKMTTKIK